MGQYHVIVNLDRRQYVDQYALGGGAKLLEQGCTEYSTPLALMLLLAVSNGRGGGDFNLTNDVLGEPLPERALKRIGSWGGDRIAVVGDYAERGDLPPEFEADLIYTLCASAEELAESQEHARGRLTEVEAVIANPKPAMVEKYPGYVAGFKAERQKILTLLSKTPADLYEDISADLALLLEADGGFVYVGKGWKSRYYPGGKDVLTGEPQPGYELRNANGDPRARALDRRAAKLRTG